MVTGVGAVTPLGLGAETLLDRWCAGDVGFSDGLARCSDFRPEDFLSVRDVRRTDRFAQLAIVAADEALSQAGWAGELPYDAFQIACLIGTALGGDETFERQFTAGRENALPGVSPLTVPVMMANAGAAAISLRHGLRGPSVAVSTACASGADAIAGGVRLIRGGEVDAAVVGGAESAVSPFIRAAFGSMGATSPSGVCRPFDARRDGFVLGEAAGVLILEEGALARKRGAPVLGSVIGMASTSDAHHLTHPDRSGRAVVRAIRRALEDANVTTEQVCYINAHGTGTALNDRVETEAIKSAFDTHAEEIPVTATKSATGHSLGAAGAVEALVTVLALRKGVAPPTLGYAVVDAGLDLDYVPGRIQPLPPREEPSVALSNSFGFGGHNVVLVLQVDGAAT